MKQRWMWSLGSLIVVLLLATACDQVAAPAPASPPPATVLPGPSSSQPTQAPAKPTTAAAGQPTQGPGPVVVQTLPPNTPNATGAAAGPTPTTVKAALSCPAPQALAANAQLAARVNGQGVSLDAYNREVAQATASFVEQGIDTKSAGGQEALKSLKQQVLDQLINDVVIAQQADKEGIKVTDNDLNARLAEMLQDAGSVDKLNEYLKTNQLSLTDFCQQIRMDILGTAMLNRVTAALPTNVEQIHIRQILVSSPQTAQDILKQLRAGGDFAKLAQQYSLDEASKVNGGDLGWSPRGRFDPQLEAIAFQLKPGQISDVIQTQFGYHIIKLDERDNSRPLPPEMIQNARQQAFLAWLQAVRQGMKIEQLVQP